MSGQSPASVPDGGLGLQRVEEGRSEAIYVVDTLDVSVRAVLSRQVSVAFGNPVPQQAEDEPAAGERRHKQEQDEAPADLHKGGPEVQQVRKVITVLDVPKLNVAAAIFSDQTRFKCPVSSWLEVALEQLEHPGAGHNQRAVSVDVVHNRKSSDFMKSHWKSWNSWFRLRQINMYTFSYYWMIHLNMHTHTM